MALNKLDVKKRNDLTFSAIHVNTDATLDELIMWAETPIDCKQNFVGSKITRVFTMRASEGADGNLRKVIFFDGNYLIKLAPGVIQVCTPTTFNIFFEQIEE